MSETKQSNPKDALGIKKVPLHAVPTKPLLEVGLAMMEGGRKYGTHNYRSIGVRVSTYHNAAMRHLLSWWEGEDIDPESGVPHIVKAMASLFVLRDAMHMNKAEDDRPIRYPDGINMESFNKMAAGIIEKYPECVEPFLETTKVVQEESIKEIAAIKEYDHEPIHEKIKAITKGLEPAEDEEFWTLTNDGMMYCEHIGCTERGFAKKATMKYFCPKHKETKDE